MKTTNRTLNHIKKATVTLIAAGITFMGLQSFAPHNGDHGATAPNSATYRTLNRDMQKLWADHMQWTYSTVDAFFNNPKSLDASLARLLQNQKDIGNAVVPFYGQAGGDQLAKLLTEHITGAVPVLQAAKAGDNDALKKALDDWYANAQQIADFLSTANPHWGKKDMREMMKMHIDQTTSYAVDLLKGDYSKAIQTYDEANSHMVMMADMLTGGLAKQFPDKF
ncbi:MAG TPA: hypothetical protein PKD45_05880 [Flavobacteriales bacterium]|nr:hypothetical protein [Flavobacteriales bacterium]